MQSWAMQSWAMQSWAMQSWMMQSWTSRPPPRSPCTFAGAGWSASARARSTGWRPRSTWARRGT
eukprot:2068257-Prymnesium_polylepis.1